MSKEQKLSDVDKEIIDDMEKAGEIEPGELTPEKKEEKKEPAEKPAEEKSKPNEEEDEKKEEEEEEKKEEKKEDPKSPAEDKKPRPEKYMPLDQFQNHKRDWQKDTEKKDIALAKKDEELNTLKEQLEKSSTKSSMADIAKKFNIDPELLTELASAIKADALPPKDVLEKIDKIEHDAKLVEQSNRFDQEFLTLDLKAKYPDSTAEQIESAKKRLVETAHTERYSSYPLADIIAIDKEIQDILKPIEVKKTLESGRKPTQKAKASNDERLDNIDDLSNKELDELMDDLAKEGSKFNLN